MTVKCVKWTLWSLDIWGNAEDGWEFNDRSKDEEFECDVSMYADDDAIKTLLETLDGMGWHFMKGIKEGYYAFPKWENEYTVGIYRKKDDKPLYTIEADEYVF